MVQSFQVWISARPGDDVADSTRLASSRSRSGSPYSGSHQTLNSELDVVQDSCRHELTNSADKPQDFSHAGVCPFTIQGWQSAISAHVRSLLQENKIKPRAGDGGETRGFREWK